MVAFGIKTPPQHGPWADFLDVWRAADDIDIFESAWTMDHFYPLTPPLDGTHLESWTVLAALAQATKRLRLGCMVTLDHISGGRFNLGLGAGWFEPESKAYGIPLGTLKQRFDRFDEGLEVITSLLTNEHTNFSGNYYQLTNARCEPKPVQSRIPIVIGGRGPNRTLPAAARWADMWDIAGPESPATWKATSDILDQRCAAIGRDPAEIRRSVHLMWPEEADPNAMASTAADYAAAGVDLVIFSMRAPYRAARLEPLVNALLATN
jgi:alkanesulfonate monooxygenase SsuD/methylene tetrahydromethanopterin reductase-like flavin-dependent oxidoreductase (luciferase family)